MKRIVVIIGNLGIGGAERLVVDEVNEMYKRGIDITLVTLLPEGQISFLPSCIVPRANRVYVPFGSLFDIGAWRRLVRFLRQTQPDVVITHLWFANTVGRIAGRCARVSRIISFEHNVYDQVKTGKQFLVDRLLQSLSIRIVAVSSAVSESLIAHGITPSRIVVIENGIDLSRYANARPIDIRKSEGLGDGPAFLFVGRLIEQKGVDVLLDAFAHVAEGNLLIAGDGPDRKKLERQAEGLGIMARVRFLGIRSDIPVLMKSVTCLVLPSRWEGQGLVIPEAFAAGLPVIAADFPAVFSMVKNEENGLIVPRENAQELARAMKRVSALDIRDRFVLEALKSAARFSIELHVNALLSDKVEH